MNELERSACAGTAAELLPWYVNDTLDESEREFVRVHLESCDACRRDAEMLAQLQHSIRTESPSPLVAAPQSEKLLAALDRSERRSALRRRWPWLATAAAVVVAIGATTLLLMARAPSVDTPTRYETATSPGTVGAINFVVELEFGAGVTDATRAEFLESMDTMGAPVSTGDRRYRLVLAPGSLSLAELEVYIEGIRSRPEVSAVEVVAVQLPVE